MPVQVLNTEQIGLLEAHFQPRNEPNFAWKSCVSAFLALPALRAFWPMSAVDYQNPQATDVSGHGYDLTNNNSADFGYDDLAPYVEFDGSTQYLSRASAAGNWANVTGTEAYVVSTQRGLTFGGWFYVESHDSDWEFLIGKTGAGAPNRAYWIDNSNAPNYVARFVVSVDGTAQTILTMEQLTVDSWEFVVGRFVPSTTVDGYVNNVKYTQAAAVPASIFDNATAFTVAANSVPALYTEMKASNVFLCAAALSDATIGMLFHWTRRMYGV